MKKLLFFILVTLFQLLANAETYNVVIDGIKYELTYINKGGSVYTNAEVIANSYFGDIVIPVSVTYNGTEYNVTSIGDYAFNYCTGLASVTIPNSVINIGNDAFSGCTGLTSVIIPNSVTSIGSSVFMYCTGLTSVIIPNSVTSISYQTFSNCKALTSVTIPNSVTSIDGCAFSGCSSLASITIPESVTNIGNSTFSGCSSLASVTIPNSVTNIGSSAFENCSSLNSVIIGNSVTSISYQTFSNCKALTSVTIPNSVTSIGDYAFCNCTGLASVTIPNSVTSIGDAAFYSCSGLKKVIVPDIAAWCGINNNSNPLSYAHHLYSDESTEIKDLVIPNSVTSIGDYAFNYCTGLASVTIPNSVINIGNDAFSGCTGLTSVTTPNSVTSIGSKAFYHCTGLSQASIGSGSIGDNSFEDCNSLTSLTIGNGVKYIGYSAFKGCSRLTSVTMGNSINFISANAFASCPELIDVYCYAVNVPTTSSTVFKDSYIEYATLHVPDVSIELYKQASPWNTFKEIVPLTVNTYILTYMVDDEMYKKYEVDYGTPITPEPEPTKEGYIFSGWSEIPETMPAQDVTIYGYFKKEQKCATPTISYASGKLKFHCETEDVNYTYEIKDSDIKIGYDKEVDLTVTYNITVYATKDGYQDSEAATATLCWIDDEPQTEGTIDGDAIAEVKAMPILIQSQGGTITIQGAAEGTPITIYDISGKLYGSTLAEKDRTTIVTSLRPGSVAIVKIGEKTIKVRL